MRHLQTSVDQILGFLVFKAVYNQPASESELKQVTELPLSQLRKRLHQLRKIKLIRQQAAGEWSLKLTKLPKSIQKQFKALAAPLKFSEKNWQYQTRLIKKHLPRLARIPGIINIAVCNAYAFKTTTKSSDIDLFIICNHKFMFLSRLLTVIYLQLMGVRLHGKKTQNRFCLSFWISTKHLQLDSVRRGSDPYFYYWFRTLQWWVRSDKTKDCTKNLIKKNKYWLAKFGNKNQKFRFQKALKRYTITQDSFLKRILNKNFIQKLVNLLTSWQINRAKAKYKQQGQPKGVQISRSILKFHNPDRRPEINRAFWYLYRQIKHYYPDLKS